MSRNCSFDSRSAVAVSKSWFMKTVSDKRTVSISRACISFRSWSPSCEKWWCRPCGRLVQQRTSLFRRAHPLALHDRPFGLRHEIRRHRSDALPSDGSGQGTTVLGRDTRYWRSTDASSRFHSSPDTLSSSDQSEHEHRTRL